MIFQKARVDDAYEKSGILESFAKHHGAYKKRVYHSRSDLACFGMPNRNCMRTDVTFELNYRHLATFVTITMNF